MPWKPLVRPGILDARVEAVLVRAAASASPTAVLSAALSVDPVIKRDDFFRHLFGDTDDVRGTQTIICLRLELLPVLLQRAVAAALVLQAKWLSASVLHLCLVRARSHVQDKVRESHPEHDRSSLIRAHGRLFSEFMKVFVFRASY